MRTIDAHVHFAGDHRDSVAMLKELDLLVLNVCVAYDDKGNWWKQAENYRRLAQEHPETYAWCTSFDLPDFADPGYVDGVIAGLERDFAAGAAACKVWKNFGLEVRRPSGEYTLVDDPLLEPIFDYLVATDRTVLMHIAEPSACWMPLDDANPLVDLLRRQPKFHLYNRPGLPSHQQLIAARDRVLARHPNMRAVGAHLASLEHDVEVLAETLDRFPNLAVDTSARITSLSRQDPEKVRQFFLDYQDRVLFGTDSMHEALTSEVPEEERLQVNARFRDRHLQYLAFLEGPGPVRVEDRDVPGLALPEPVLEKVLRTNAVKWYPLLAEALSQ